MDPVKVIIFVAVFLMLLVLGRKLSELGSSTPYPSSAPLPPDGPLGQSTNQPAAIGAELPFPIYLPELTRDSDGRYNRPEFHNYYFEKTDLVKGPYDPTVFYDYFRIEARDVESNHRIVYEYFVATPLGLQKALSESHIPALHLKQHAFIFSRWNLPVILETVVKHIIEAYLEGSDEEANMLPDQDSLG